MTHIRLLAIFCLVLGGACMISCASNSVNMKPDSTIAAEIVATPSPVPESSPEPTPAGIAPEPTPEAQAAPEASAPNAVRSAARSKKTVGRLPRSAGFGSQAVPAGGESEARSNGQEAACSAEMAAAQEGLDRDNPGQEFWTPTPIVQAGFASQTQAEAASGGHAGGWLLAGLVLLLAVAVVLLTYRRVNLQTAKSRAAEHPAREEQHHTSQEPVPVRPAPVEAEPRHVVPAVEPETPAAAPTTDHKPVKVRRVRKPAAKPRVAKTTAKPRAPKTGAKSGTRIHKTKSEARKKAA